MQVLNNAPAFSVWKSYTNNVKNLRGSMSRLSSGLKIESAADDPAGLAISERLRAQARNSAAAAQNIENALSYAQTADSWMQKIQDIAGRMGELAVAANDGTKTQTDRDQLQKEFTQMQKEITRITSNNEAAANYNGSALFQGATVSLQVGPNQSQTFDLSTIDLQSSSTEAMATAGAGTATWGAVITEGTAATVLISSATDAAAAVGTVNAAVDFISGKRATLGAQSARMKHSLEGLRTYESNIRGAESQIRDVDMAKEATDFSKYQILTQVGTAMLAQANSLPQGVMRLIQ